LSHIPVTLFKWFWSFFAPLTPHEEAVKDLMKELTIVRREVSKEYQWLKGLGVKKVKSNGETTEVDEMTQRKRLIYLFVKDMSGSGAVGGDMLSNKAHRDSQLSSSSKADRVSPRLKLCSWLFLIFSNIGMLFYVYLFAMNQTQSRQSAWFLSFVTWLLFEIFVSSTALVLVLHLLVPLYVLADVLKLKEKALVDLMLLREKCSQTTSDPQNETISATQDGRPRSAELHQGAFNAAKYLFRSWRVAAMLRDLPESKLILQYSTPWPKRKFGVEEGKVAKEYEAAIGLTTLSRIVLFFMGSFLRSHALVQDLIVQTLCNSTLGYLGVVLLRLSAVHPLLPLLVVAVLLLCLHFVVKLCSAKTMKKLSDSTAPASQSTPQDASSLTEAGPKDSLFLEEGPRDATNNLQDDGEAAEMEMEGEDEDGLGFEFDEEAEAEESSDQSLRLEMFVPASALGSSSSSRSSSGQFWNQMFSLWSSKSESSDEWLPHFDSGDEESDHSSSSSSGSRSSNEDDSSVDESRLRQRV
jgi:hypothetical protein